MPGSRTRRDHRCLRQARAALDAPPRPPRSAARTPQRVGAVEGRLAKEGGEEGHAEGVDHAKASRGAKSGPPKAPAQKKVAKKAPPKKAVAKKAPPKKLAPKKPVAKKATRRSSAERRESRGQGLAGRDRKKSGKKTVICELSGFEVTPSPANLSPKTLERLQAEAPRRAGAPAATVRGARGRGRAARTRPRRWRHAVRRGVGRGRHRQRRAGARPAPVGIGASGRRGHRRGPRSDETRDLRRVPVRRPSSAARTARAPAVGRRVRRLQGACRAPTVSLPRRGRDDGRSSVRSSSVIVAVDQLTKIWAVARLDDGPISLVGDDVQLRLSRNTGRRVQPLPGVHAAPRGPRRRCSPCCSSARFGAPTTPG